MHRRIPSWWRVAGESGTKLLYEPEKPVRPCRLHRANHLHLGKAASHPRGGPRHHSCGAERLQEGPLSTGEMLRGLAARHLQQALLHQLVGHVLAHRPPQEAKDMMTRVLTESAKFAVGALGAHFVMSMGYTDADFMQTLCRLLACE